MWQTILTILIGVAAVCYLGWRIVLNLRRYRKGESPCSCCSSEGCPHRKQPRCQCDKKKRQSRP